MSARRPNPASAALFAGATMPSPEELAEAARQIAALPPEPAPPIPAHAPPVTRALAPAPTAPLTDPVAELLGEDFRFDPCSR